ncbi:MAG: hypothetical protein Q6363_003000 [Candidatus Njordarchaeota archaeon]
MRIVITKEIMKLSERRPILTPKIVSASLFIPIKTARRLLLHLEKTKRLHRICKGYYTINFNPLVIGTFLNYPAYLSFLSALSIRGLSTQIPKKYIFACLHRWRGKKDPLKKINIEYIKIPKRAFVGYIRQKSKNDVYFIAEPEKAIADMIYVDKNPLNYDINWAKISLNKIRYYSKFYTKKIREKIQWIINEIHRRT